MRNEHVGKGQQNQHTDWYEVKFSLSYGLVVILLFWFGEKVFILKKCFWQDEQLPA
jgi:hypothetical protein